MHLEEYLQKPKSLTYMTKCQRLIRNFDGTHWRYSTPRKKQKTYCKFFESLVRDDIQLIIVSKYTIFCTRWLKLMLVAVCFIYSQNNYTRSAECFRFFLNMVPIWLVKEDMIPTTNIFKIAFKLNQNHVSKERSQHCDSKNKKKTNRSRSRWEEDAGRGEQRGTEIWKFKAKSILGSGEKN